MYTKTIVVDVNWLAAIDGMKVSSAIEYLKNLNQEHVLSYSLEGDTHGVDLSSELLYQVPMTNKEILAKLEKTYARKIADREKQKAYVIERNQLDRVPNVDRQIADIQAKLEAARTKYGE